GGAYDAGVTDATGDERSYRPDAHYDRGTAAWTLLLGKDLHYGVFENAVMDLTTATQALTDTMIEAAQIRAGNEVLDVGCGIGTPACQLAARFEAVVTGITTSDAGVQAARANAHAQGVGHLTTFEQRDGMDNGFSDTSFDRVWALESSHLMRHRDRLIAECARVLRRGGRLALCDIVRRRPLDLAEVRRLRKPLTTLRHVFGDARMDPIAEYRRLAEQNGLVVEGELDLTDRTRPTFDHWRRNAERHRDEVVELLSESDWDEFVESCGILERFWDDGTLGYALMSASKA